MILTLAHFGCFSTFFSFSVSPLTPHGTPDVRGVGEALRILGAGVGLESFPCPLEDERPGASQEGAANATPSDCHRGGEILKDWLVVSRNLDFGTPQFIEFY